MSFLLLCQYLNPGMRVKICKTGRREVDRHIKGVSLPSHTVGRKHIRREVYEMLVMVMKTRYVPNGKEEGEK